MLGCMPTGVGKGSTVRKGDGAGRLGRGGPAAGLGWGGGERGSCLPAPACCAGQRLARGRPAAPCWLLTPPPPPAPAEARPPSSPPQIRRAIIDKNARIGPARRRRPACGVLPASFGLPRPAIVGGGGTHSSRGPPFTPRTEAMHAILHPNVSAATCAMGARHAAASHGACEHRDYLIRAHSSSGGAPAGTSTPAPCKCPGVCRGIVVVVL